MPFNCEIMYDLVSVKFSLVISHVFTVKYVKWYMLLHRSVIFWKTVAPKILNLRHSFRVIIRLRSVYLFKIRNVVRFNCTATFTILRPSDSTNIQATGSVWIFKCRYLHGSLSYCKTFATNDNKMWIKFRLVLCFDQIWQTAVLTNFTVTIYKLDHVDVKEHLVISTQWRYKDSSLRCLY